MERSRRLVALGIIAGPLFLAVALLQVLTRPGFDLSRHAISALSNGDLGWVQVANFIGSGLLIILCAFGLRSALREGRAATGGPILIGAHGLGLVGAGIFTTDPALGFPPGAPAGAPETFSQSAMLHSVSFIVAEISIIAATFVFARRFSSLRLARWAAYSVATGIAVPALVVAGFANLIAIGVAFFLSAVASFIWLTTMATREYVEISASSGGGDAR